MIYVTSLKIGHYEGSYWYSGPNSAGGVSVKISVANKCSQTVNYVDVYTTAYDAVGEPAPCSINGNATRNLHLTGPFEPGKVQREVVFENVWYNTTIKNIDIERIEVTYSDGTHETFSGRDARNIPSNLQASEAAHGYLTGFLALVALVGIFILAIAIGNM